MELRHLRYFQTVARTLSFSRAAEELRIAQPAISRQIAALEEELALKLFVRTTNRVRLTDAGKHFHQEVDRLLAQLAVAVTGAQQIARGRGGELNLGMDWRILLPQIPEAVRRFRAAHSQVAVNFVELSIHSQIEALHDGRIHLGFIPENIAGSRAGLDVRPIYSADIKAVVSTHHPLAGAGAVALRDLKGQTWIRLDEKNHPGFRAFITQLCHPALFTPAFGRVAGSIEGMLAFVAMGDGICLLPASLIPHHHRELSFLDTDCARFEVQAVWPKAAPDGGRARFLQILSETLAAADSPPPPPKRRAAPRRAERSLRPS